VPNHCSNTLTIIGPKADLKKFIDGATPADNAVGQYGGRQISILKSYYPIPRELAEASTAYCTAEPHPNWATMVADGTMSQEEYDDLVLVNAEQYRERQENLAKFGFADWYDWANVNWGTKWGDYDTFVRFFDDDEVKISFTSAWSPPLSGIAHVSGLFPTLSFVLTYDEPGMGFFGAASFRNGDTCFDVERSASEFSVDADADEVDAWESIHEDTQEALIRLHLKAASALGVMSAL
jgi:hypothetical protein